MKSRNLLAVRETPAGRARQKGVAVLSSVELISLISGITAEKARSLLDRADHSLRKLSVTINGHDSPQLHAAFELARRTAAEERPEGSRIRWPRDVFELMAPKIQALPVEEFHVVALDSQHRVEKDITVTRGLLNSSLVHPREVFRQVIAENAAAVILVHNHPSGDPTPSADDRVVTEQLVQAGKLLDIPVQDHVIVGRGRYTSFAEAGIL